MFLVVLNSPPVLQKVTDYDNSIYSIRKHVTPIQRFNFYIVADSDISSDLESLFAVCL